MTTLTIDDETIRHLASTQWIAGRAIAARGDEWIRLLDPASGKLLADVPRGCPDDAEYAIAAARRAQGDWARRAVAQRGAMLRQAAHRLREIQEPVVELLVRNNGKTLAEARAEVAMCPPLIESLVELGHQLGGRCVQTSVDELLFQYRNPRGVAVCLSTWNAPVVAAIEMAAACLIVGNTCVLKTSERAPLAPRLAFERCFDHLPEGVLSVLCGDGPNMGSPLVSHSETDVVCFIGSVGVGRRIAESAGRRVRKAILELGGKDAFIIDETVDPRVAARFVAPTCFALSGQICSSTERIYVMRQVYEPFVEEMAAVTSGLRVGPGLDPTSQMGPLIDESILTNVENHVSAATAAGARTLVGGRRLDRPGCFYAPTVLTGVDDGMLVMQEETFGPIAPILAVDTFDEAIARANGTSFGLCANVCTQTGPRAIQAIHELEAGVVRINAGRGGIMHCSQEPTKNSGIGSGHGIEFLEELTYRKSVRWRGKLAES